MAWSDPLAHSLAALADVRDNGAGERYLIQHSAGSGKSNSITWLSHQLIGVKRSAKEVFDSAIVVTDARILDAQIRKTIKPFMQVIATVGFAEYSGNLRNSSNARSRESNGASANVQGKADWL
jgi:type I restriction enzyme, R subunit